MNMSLGDFKRFDSLMKNFGISYLLGVTPYPCLEPLNWKSASYRELTDEETKMLRGLENVELAMHGVTHQTCRYGLFKRLFQFHSEFVGLSWEQTISKLKHGLKLFEKYGLKRPRVYIPPYNTFDKYNLEVFKEYFKYITSGPETKKFIKKNGKKQIIVSDYYGHCGEIQPPEKDGCVTIHWAWETRDDFLELERLLAKLNGKVSNWSELK